MNNKPLIIFHSPCPDGLCAAWVARNFLRKCENTEVDLYPTTYGATVPDVKDRAVYILDFSYPKDVLLEMAKVAKSITVLDHHVSAQKELDDIRRKEVDGKIVNGGFDESNLLVIFDMNKSGAMLTWDYFYGDIDGSSVMPIPLLVEYVQDRDLWNWKLPMSREINAAISSYELNVDVYEKLSHKTLNELYDEGFAILRYQNKEIEEIVKTSFLGVFAGYNVPVLNCMVKSMTSEAGNRLAKGYPFSVCWAMNEKGEYVYSLRSITTEANPMGRDVSEIAKSLGGGGHRNAAGCMSKVQLIQRYE